MKVKKLLDSFNYAIEGIIYSVRTQRNMKIHMIAALLVLVICFIYDLSKMEILAVIITISIVIIAELFNTAVESAIDATINYYHPLAKIAKNVAAGGVLVAAVNAVVVGYIIFWDKLKYINFIVMRKVKSTNPYVIFIILAIVFITTIIIKAIFGEGTPLKGGMPSGHSAIAFSIATTIALISEQLAVVILSYLLAFIVAQSRVDSDTHSVIEVVCGGAFGVLITVFLFRVFG
ncbi:MULTISPECIES: diacylglycerol kinase [Clostridium]|uniref:Undecaprenol kinase n=5 Tax=Clostridium TaxID=1485 RepID=A0A162L2Q2_9CLOT|nr:MULTISPECIES: diacylglycerol kinase [Clostridium]ADK13877.1 diacylglycerol kinase [Clostridium ljungdahlii DSM 13528]AGY77109.1 diacylglycerol kinase [Clostridium autoethanogenum DSM 10061]ALU37251.1 Prokaryotic diacylglycerol kinase [Clostridium autoethanogenum DSM 10061]OAA83548.1 Undecaprenol kinase [Clostridium ljungdahlii]OAA87367.1 Undecaprenol kinase [Clostridium ljungdahlii DSM 13528]